MDTSLVVLLPGETGQPQIRLEVPREIDADSPEAAERFVELYQAERAAGRGHNQARAEARRVVRSEFPKSDLTLLMARRRDAQGNETNEIDEDVRAAAIAASRDRIAARRAARAAQGV